MDGDAGVPPDAAPELPVCVAAVEVCDGTDNDCDDEVDSSGTCPDRCAGFTLDGRGYMFCSEALTRALALTRCGAQGMRLAWLETPEESLAVRDGIIAANVPAPDGNPALLTQIGASDAEDDGEWSWVGSDAAPDGFQFWDGESGGEAVDDTYVDWADLEPSADEDEDCVAVLVLASDTRAAGQWDDRFCDEPLPFVCEVP